jgi:hypothetical protein
MIQNSTGPNRFRTFRSRKAGVCGGRFYESTASLFATRRPGVSVQRYKTRYVTDVEAGGRSAPSETPTVRRVTQTAPYGVCGAHREPGTQGLPSACPGAARMCLFCLVQQQFWRPTGSAEDRPITVESWSLPMNKR